MCVRVRSLHSTPYIEVPSFASACASTGHDTLKKPIRLQHDVRNIAQGRTMLMALCCFVSGLAQNIKEIGVAAELQSFVCLLGTRII